MQNEKRELKLRISVPEKPIKTAKTGNPIFWQVRFLALTLPDGSEVKFTGMITGYKAGSRGAADSGLEIL